jgi:hypothetical protein
MLGCIYIIAAFVIWRPEITTEMANFLGMGRGLDLFFVLFFILCVNSIIFLIKIIHTQHLQITKLARKIALIDKLSGDIDVST